MHASRWDPIPVIGAHPSASNALFRVICLPVEFARVMMYAGIGIDSNPVHTRSPGDHYYQLFWIIIYTVMWTAPIQAVIRQRDLYE